jgi:hypothetical protein
MVVEMLQIFKRVLAECYLNKERIGGRKTNDDISGRS